MTLYILNAGREPLGQFDGYTGETLTFLGGEVCSWRGELQSTAATLGAQDVPNDGYINEGGLGFVVPAISKTWGGSGMTVQAPFFLADDGLGGPNGYGTLFGTVVGRFVGEVSYGASSSVASTDLLGPHTAAGSGKITVWDKPGLYGCSLTNVDTASDGLIVTNTALRVGTKLTFTATGLLTPNRSTNSVLGTGSDSPIIGHLASFETNGSVVTTPTNLVAALNSPSGSVSSLQQQKMTMAVFNFAGSGGSVS